MAIVPQSPLALPVGESSDLGNRTIIYRPVRIAEVDDLNRIVLASSCEALPSCRDRDVTLVLGLTKETIRIRADSRSLERAVTSLIDDASALAMSAPGRKLRVETSRDGSKAALRLTTEATMHGVVMGEAFAGAQRVVEQHGGALHVTERPGTLMVQAEFPIHEPGNGDLEGRIEIPRSEGGSAMGLAPSGPLDPAGAERATWAVAAR